MSFVKAIAFAAFVFALAGASILPTAAAKLHKGHTHPHVTTGLSNSTSSRAGAAQGVIGGRAGAGVTIGGAGGTAIVGAGAEGGGGMGGGMSGGGGM